MTSLIVDRLSGAASGTAAIKAPVRVATTANIDLSGLQTVDGVALAADDRVLVKDQTDTTENGLYVAATSGWSRATDFDGANDAVNGTVVYVRQGTVGTGFWYCTASDPITVGSDAIGFARASSVLAVLSAFAQTLLDDADAGAAQTTLGISTFAKTLLDDADATAAQATLSIAPAGQCLLSRSSATQIALSRRNGSRLYINGRNETIPAAGVTASNTSLSASTVYYVYAYMSAGTMALELSTTTHTTDGTSGVEVKSGDATRTLVGMVRTNGSSQFADSQTQRFVASWFNRRRRDLTQAITAVSGVASTTFAELSTSLRVEFVTWSDELVEIDTVGQVTDDTLGAYGQVSAGLDGTAASQLLTMANAYAASKTTPAVAKYRSTTTEGYHYVAVMGLVSTGIAGITAGQSGAVTI